MEDFSGHLAQVNHKETQEMADFAGVTEPKTLNAYEILRKRLIDTLEMQSDHDTEDDDIVKALQQSIEGFQFGLSNAEQRVDQLSAKLTAQRERIHDLERGISNYEEKNKFLANIFQGAEQKVFDQGKLIRDMNIHINKLESNARDSFAESEQIAKQNLALQTTIRAKDMLIAKLKELIPLL
jgi:chromosome segregation ATPase